MHPAPRSPSPTSRKAGRCSPCSARSGSRWRRSPVTRATRTTGLAGRRVARVTGDLLQREIAGYARDSDDGPGWSALLDLQRVPEKGLAWLAQFWGARIEPSLELAPRRER